MTPLALPACARQPQIEMSIATIDTFLAECVRACLQASDLPPWDTRLSPHLHAAASQRALFHGICLLLWEQKGQLTDWPDGVVETIRDEARLQTFWEASHRAAISALLEALNAQGIDAAVMKGTALAYSLYGNPAIRRRGDSDLLVMGDARDVVRGILRQSGFEHAPERHGLQESWSLHARDGFVHEIDVHWQMSSSPTISKALARIHPHGSWVSLARLSPHARGLGLLHSLIMTCINRAAHGTFGYFVESDRVKETDRLIWAIDIHLLCDRFGDEEWRRLPQLGEASGASELVRSGLMFARQSLGSFVPDDVLAALASAAGPQPVTHYLNTASQRQRVMMDWNASPTWSERLALLHRNAFPDRAMLMERYPKATGWPLPALHLLRLVTRGWRLFVQ